MGVPSDTALSADFAVPVSQRVVAEARRCAADLIVIGTHGRRGMKRLLLGSSAESVLRESAIPVLLVRNAAPPGTDTQAAQCAEKASVSEVD